MLNFEFQFPLFHFRTIRTETVVATWNNTILRLSVCSLLLLCWIQMRARSLSLSLSFIRSTLALVIAKNSKNEFCVAAAVCVRQLHVFVFSMARYVDQSVHKNAVRFTSELIWENSKIIVKIQIHTADSISGKIAKTKKIQSNWCVLVIRCSCVWRFEQQTSSARKLKK